MNNNAEAIKKAKVIFSSDKFLENISKHIDNFIQNTCVTYNCDHSNVEEGEKSIDGEISISDFEVIEYLPSEKIISVEITVNVPISLDVSYKDRSNATYDKEDDTYFGEEYVNTSIEETISIDAYIEIDTKKNEVMECNIHNKEIEIYENDTYYK